MTSRRINTLEPQVLGRGARHYERNIGAADVAEAFQRDGIKVDLWHLLECSIVRVRHHDRERLGMRPVLGHVSVSDHSYKAGATGSHLCYPRPYLRLLLLPAVHHTHLLLLEAHFERMMDSGHASQRNPNK